MNKKFENMSQIIEIDGSYGEGGGQIVRTALALAAIARKKTIVKNIRAKRSNPGLRPQHLSALEAIERISNGKIEGLKVGSSTVTYVPGKELSGGRFGINIGTAGSVSLVIQCILPVLIFSRSNSEVRISGGTDVKWSPTIDYMKHVFIPDLKLFGINASLEIIRRGYYPKGGGTVKLYVEPVKKLNSITLSKKPIKSVEIRSVCSNLPRHVAERQAKAAIAKLGEKGIKVDNVVVEVLSKDKAVARGTSIVIIGRTEDGLICGGDSIGEIGKPAEKVGEEAAERFLRWVNSKAAVDIHLGDMLIPYASLADSETTYTVDEITGHIISSLYVEKLILGADYNVQKIDKDLYEIRIKGLGLQNEFLS